MSNFKELVKHSGNYLFATLATKALAFISIPVYTSLLTVEEYGIYNIFISTVGISTVLLTLNSEVAISRYYYDAKDSLDFKQFVGTSVNLTTLIFICLSIISLILCKPLSRYLEFEVALTIAIIPVSLYNIINSVFQQIYQPLLQSRKIAIVTSVQAYLAFVLSVVIMLFLKQDRYYGQVWGTIAAMLIVGVYSIKQISPYYISSFNKSHLRYIINYAVPYLPYSLSGVIISQFGKIIISQQHGFESAGLYSFVSNIAMLMLVAISVIHSAWNPYYFKYMNEKDYKTIDRDYDFIWRFTLLCAVGLTLYGREIGMVLGKAEYVDGMRLLPILVIGYCFYQWSFVYMRNVGYAKKTIWNAVVVVTSGIANLVMNSMFIQEYGDYGVSLSFMLSYVIMVVVGYLVNRFILKVYATSVLAFLLPFLLTIPVYIIEFYEIICFQNVFAEIILKFLICLFYFWILLHNYLSKFGNLFNK